MTKFRVTLNMTFTPHYWDDYSSYEENKTEKKAKKAAFERTDNYFAEHDVVAYIKENDALATVENLFSMAEVLSAEWDPEKFAIHMIVETDESEEEIRSDLELNSLEDGEYEGCGDSAWMVFTRGKNGEPLGPPWDMKDFWEYGLVDYRENPIEITPIVESTS